MPKLLAIAAALGLALCQWLIFVWSPVEASMGLIQKIFYLHLPLAWWALISFALVCAGSITYLWRRSAAADRICAAAAELGVLFSGLALLDGMIWGKKSWGVWWTWDPRLSTTLVMWFLYAAYLVIRHLDLPDERKRAVCAVVGIAAFLDVPLVFFSARLFRSIHPAVIGAQDSGLEPEMKATALCCLAAFGLLWGALLWIRAAQLRMEAMLDALRMTALLEDKQ